MKITENKLRGITKMFSDIAKEEIRIDFIGNAIYVFGSELACLRIFYKYRYTKTARVEYSKNLNTWCFSYETPFETYEMP
jgi:hypothetical protein